MNKEQYKELLEMKKGLMDLMDEGYSPLYVPLDKLIFSICKVIDMVIEMGGENFEEGCEDAPKSEAPEPCLFCNKQLFPESTRDAIAKEDRRTIPFGRGAY